MQEHFLKPHSVTVTDTRRTIWKYTVNIFPKDITQCPDKDSNLGYYDSGTLTTIIPQRQRYNLGLYVEAG